jgi:hypothetical protein
MLTVGHDSRIGKVVVTEETAMIVPSWPQPTPHMYAIANLVQMAVLLTLFERYKILTS